MGKGALAFIAGLGTGYLNQRNREEEKARQDKFDQIALDRADRERQDYEKKQRVANRLADASKPGEVKYENVAHQGVPMLSAQDTLPGEDPVQATSQQQPIASQGLGLSKADTSTNIRPPMAPIASQGLGGYTRKVTFNGKEYADESAAKADIEKYDSPEARNARYAQVLREEGDYASAMDLEAKAKQADLADFQMKVEKRKEALKLKSEGVFDAVAALRRGDPAALKKAFNESGLYKIEGEPTMVPVERDIPGFGKQMTHQTSFTVVDEKGNRRPMSYNSHDLSMQLMPFEKALDWDHTIFKEKNRQDQWKQEFDHKKKIDSVNTGISAGHLALSRERENRQTLVGQLQDKERALGRKLSEDERNNLLGVDTMPQAIKMQVSSLLKEQEQISQALNKAQADDSFVATDKEGKPNPLIVRSASLNMQLEKLLNYKNKINDPLGIMSPNPQAPPIASQVGIANKPQVSSDAAVKKMPPPLASKGILSPAVDGIDLRDDPVLSSLKQQLSLLDINDPANMNKIMALGKAKNERLEQLQDKHGRLTKLIVE